ncbi:uncharacterized protein LOC123513645 isoform X2 [Portunus trituberculatus]|nr:uncharacterized protein LOC123513645 isoform X2 [Portunus trituberculatus]
MMVMVMVMVGSVSAWPLAPQDKDGRTASEVVYLNECGVSVMKTMEPTESLQVLINASASLSAECQISLRVSVSDIGLAKYGILAFGDLRVSNDDCLSSSLLLHDNDDATDQAAVSETFCSSGSFEFRTMEDVLLVTFTHREGSEAREGALITILPEVVCGGVITSDTTIAINHHFKAPYVCNWELMPAEGQSSRLTFEEFNLSVRKRQRCTTECLVLIPGNHMTHFCGMELLRKIQYLSGKQLMSLRVTRDVSQFKCKVEFVPETKNRNHLPRGVN